ncbi:glutathione S-transferase family protein [Acinetobacter chengduensis]|uniref:Glutathione S-transferase family protein n=1 Tax=Acinetobacter chengduensis TaxID=2420890 RepID=A0ABX9TT24_9GAMM|nr:glutathione S-transferase family protein [Acinetobacter chengduensis]RLL17951.1 glutathione S-transferase family protein [Acinetobacter chengduensis]
MIRLFGRQDSTNVRKILWCLHELDLNFEHIPAGGSFGITNTPQYLALNPNGLVPCLIDQDVVLWESNTILRYLNEKHGQNSLYIQERNYRYDAEKWLDWCLSTITPIFRVLILNTVKLPTEQRSPLLLSQALNDLKNKLIILEQHLAQYAYVSGSQFSIADIALASYFISLKKLPIDPSIFKSFIHIEKWFDLLSVRRAFQKIA